MAKYEPRTYGDEIAEVYDQLYADYDPACIDFLAQLAGPGPALELGIGTGRIALPLLHRGVPLVGIDASQAMVAKLRAKPRGDEIDVQLGSFEQFEVHRQLLGIWCHHGRDCDRHRPQERQAEPITQAGTGRPSAIARAWRWLALCAGSYAVRYEGGGGTIAEKAFEPLSFFDEVIAPLPEPLPDNNSS